MNKYFDQFEAKRIFDTAAVSPSKAIDLARNYLEQYPKDYRTNYLLADLLLMIKKMNIEIVKKLVMLAHSSCELDLKDKKDRLDMNTACFAKLKIKLDILNEDWEQALKDLNFFFAMMKKNDYTINNSSDNNAFQYVKYRMGLPQERDNYYQNQLYNYSYEDMLRHVRERHVGKKDEASKGFIHEYVDIDLLFKTITSRIEGSKKYYIGLTDEVCYFKCEGLGKEKGQICNYIEVHTIFGTNKIITAYPIFAIGELEYTDLSYIQNDIVKPEIKNVKRLSRIARFNQKYNIKDDDNK